jgi:type III pantothenate kinase
MSILCIDCGNTRLKWGLRQEGGWLDQGALPLAEAESLDEVLPRPPAHVIACNVAGPVVAQALAADRMHAPLAWVHALAAQCGVTNRYEQPSQLGADRWAALVGARGLHAGPCVVVNAGTATTADVLDRTGVFQGGLILPGLALMRAALAAGTAGLPHSPGIYRELPRNTLDAITTGCLDATLGAIEHLFRSMADQPDARCILSGGAAPEIAPRLALPHRVVENLVLEGLARIAEEG